MSATRAASRPSTATPTIERFEQRRLSARRRRLLRIGIAVVVVVLVGGTAWVVFASPLLAVRNVTITGTHRTTKGLIDLTAAVPKGEPLARIDVGAVERRVEQLPLVASATVVRSWPSTITITVVERVPVAVAQSATGLRLIDKDGNDLAGTPTAPPGLTVISLDPATADPAAFKAAAAVVAGLPAVLRSVVTSVSAGTANSVDLHLVGGALVHWGDASQGAEKARILHTLLSQEAMRYNVSAPDSPTTGGSS